MTPAAVTSAASLRAAAARAVVLLLAVLLGLSLSTGTALATWTVTGTGQVTAAAAFLEAPTSPQVTQSGSSAVITWGAPAAGGTAVDGYAVRRYTGVSGAVGTATVVCQTGAAARTCTDLAPLATGSSYVVSARLAGWETAASSVALTLDSTAPVTTATAPQGNSRGWMTTSPVLVTLAATDGPAGSASGVASISYRVNGGPVTTTPGATATVPVVQQGTVQLDYWATDAAGNAESAHSLQLRIDSVAPVMPGAVKISSDTGSSNSDLVTNATQQTFTGTAENGSTVELSVRGVVVGTTTVAADGTWTLGPQQLTAGSNPVSVRSIDAAGNSSGSATSTVVVDTTAPLPAITFPVDSGSYTSATWPTGCQVAGLCGTASDGGSSVTAVSYELRSVSAGTCWGGSSFTKAACSSQRAATGTSSWSVPVAYAALPSGKSLRLTVYADDLAGNRSTALINTFTVK